MSIVALLADLGLISEAVASVIGAIAGAFAIRHAWQHVRAAITAKRA